MNKKECGFIAPFRIIKEEKFFVLWPFFILFFSCLSFLVYWSNGDVLQVFIDGAFYTFSIALCAPLIFDTLLDLTIAKKKRQQTDFVSYKAPLIVICLFLIVLCTILYGTKIKVCILAQTSLFSLTLIISFYFYLCLHMNQFPDLLEKYNDKPYIEIENASMKEIKTKSEKTEITDEGYKL